MNSRTRNLIQEIKRKVKSPITRMPEFANDDAVIDIAVQRFYESLKQVKAI
jgi:hypothetical protein